MIDRAQQRLLAALAASALLHAGLLPSGEGSSARRAAAVHDTTLTATLQPLPRDFAAPQPAVDEARVANIAPQAQRTTDAPAAAPRGAVAATAAPAVPPVLQHETPVNAGSTSTAIAGDPTYYSARSLDVYPRALTVLNLGAQAGAGTARATVLIDEAGVVNEVRAVEAATEELQQAARALLLRTRFSPAAIDGRIVKARLLISLD